MSGLLFRGTLLALCLSYIVAQAGQFNRMHRPPSPYQGPLPSPHRGTSPSRPSSPNEYVFQFSSTPWDPEYRCAYFREDMALNAFHLSFHRGYPDGLSVTRTKYYLDRRGELLYYLHQQMLARYDCERIANGLPRVKPYENLRSPILEGYFPVFPPETVKYNYRGRPANIFVHDVKNIVTLDDMEKWRTAIDQLVTTGIAYDVNGAELHLDSQYDLNIIAEAIQRTNDSINPYLYGDYHGNGHEIIGSSNDPSGIYGNDADVMVSMATAIRDPLFFRWHKHVDNLLVTFLNRFPPYSDDELRWNDVVITEITVKSELTNRINDLTTYIQRWRPLLNHGIDLQTDIPVIVTFDMLQHEEFEYQILVTNRNRNKKTLYSTMRLFMAPIIGDDGRPLAFDEQRRLFFEVDKFQACLFPGENVVSRLSSDSSVTASLEKTRIVLEDFPDADSVNVTEGHSTCGWPHNLLLPKGTVEGQSYVLFAMATNWDYDQVPDGKYEDRTRPFSDRTCYCGSYRHKYPDRKFMGYPFDRRCHPRSTLASFMNGKTNMAANFLTIRHSPQVVDIGGLFDPDFQVRQN